MENEKFIQLEKDDVLRLGIKDSNGNPTGEYLEFDLEDIELPLKYRELLVEDKKNRKWLRDENLIIDKRQDVKGEYLSQNEEDKIKAMQTFLKKEEEIYDMFLGKDGVKKLLNGRKLGWTSLEAIDKLIDKQILPHINVSMQNIGEKVKQKYKDAVERNKKVLEVE